jgi:hypothetical protein
MMDPISNQPQIQTKILFKERNVHLIWTTTFNDFL